VNSFFRKKNFKCRSCSLNGFFSFRKICFLSLFKKINEYLQNLAIPFITLIINICEGRSEHNIINDGIQGNNDNINEGANDLANEGNNEEAIPHEPANENNQLNQIYD